MMADLDFPARLRVGPTVRERDGLALSSRNVRLSRAERAQAPLLYRALKAGREAVLAPGRATARARVRAAERAMARVLSGATLGRVDYAAAVDPVTFEPPRARAHARRLLLLAAVRFPSARLIDNLPVTVNGSR
jgi:pantoate--beta-alanine ligase